MTGKNRRRVGSAFVDLDPVDVIRAKDQKSRVMASLASEASHSTAVLGTEPAMEGPTLGAEQTRTSPQNAQKQEEKPAYNSLPFGELPKLVEVTHTAGTTKRAVPDVDQPESEVPVQDNGIPTALRLDDDALNGSDHAEDVLQPPPKPVKTSGDKIMSASSRPKRASRKTYTEVDWYEDLRPTDDESPKVETRHGESTGPSPDPEYKGSRARTSSPKRKRRQSGTNCTKRRKTAKQKVGSHGQTKAQAMQVPLTPAPMISQAHNAGWHGKMPPSRDGKALQDPDANGTANISGTHLPLAKAKSKRDQDQETPALLQHEVIPIPSSSPKQIGESDSDDSKDDAGEIREQGIEAMIHGRGKSVGQKLADAMHDAGLSVQRHSVTNDLISTQLSQIATNYHESSGRGSRASASRKSLEPRYLPPEFSLEQVQSIPTLARDAETNIFAASWPVHTETLLQDPSLVDNAIGGADDVNIRDSVGLRVLFRCQEPHVSNAQDAKCSQWTKVCHTMEPVAALAHQANEPESRNVKYHNDLRDIFGTSDDVPHSSQGSAAATTDKNTSFQTQDSRNEQTPESQKPLLFKQTPRRSMITHIQRSSIVDDNGSPRLISRDRTRHRQVGRSVRLRSEKSVSTSNSRSCVLDRCSDDYTPDDRPPLSKFHLDMLLEYGVEAEDLLRGRKRPALFERSVDSNQPRRKDSTKVDQCTGHQLEPGLITVSQKQTDSVGAVERTKRSSELGNVSVTALGSSQRTIDEVGLCANKSSDGPRLDKLLSTTSSSGSSSDHSRSGVQDDRERLLWISQLQVAQKSTQNLLRTNNQVSQLIAGSEFAFAH